VYGAQLVPGSVAQSLLTFCGLQKRTPLWQSVWHCTTSDAVDRVPQQTSVPHPPVQLTFAPAHVLPTP
jgi:hypothetical protein